MINVESKGSFKHTESFLRKMSNLSIETILERYAQQGVDALAANTPTKSGETATSWYYSIETNNDSSTISWNNRHIEDGVPIAILIQYGHATRNGGYVIGTDYINPAIKPIFENIAEDLWNEVNRA